MVLRRVTFGDIGYVGCLFVCLIQVVGLFTSPALRASCIFVHLHECSLLKYRILPFMIRFHWPRQSIAVH